MGRPITSRRAPCTRPSRSKSPNRLSATSLVTYSKQDLKVCLRPVMSTGGGDALNEEPTAFLVSALLHVRLGAGAQTHERSAWRHAQTVHPPEGVVTKG